MFFKKQIKKPIQYRSVNKDLLNEIRTNKLRILIYIQIEQRRLKKIMHKELLITHSSNRCHFCDIKFYTRKTFWKHMNNLCHIMKDTYTCQNTKHLIKMHATINRILLLEEFQESLGTPSGYIMHGIIDLFHAPTSRLLQIKEFIENIDNYKKTDPYKYMSKFLITSPIL